MPEYFDANGISFIDVTLPNEPNYYLHERINIQIANCEMKILKNLNLSNVTLNCS